ncbi:MAG: glycosyl hydrolase family 18 protein [Chloroflexota bacterium]
MLSLRRGLAVALIIHLLFSLGLPTNSVAQGSRLMMGYYVPWDARSWHALEANADVLDIVSAQWVSVDPCGGIATTDDQTLKRFARERGIALFPSLVTFSGWLNHRLLTEPDVRERLLASLVDYVITEDYDGFDLDLEGVEPADRAAYTSFVASLSTMLHERGKRLSLALGPKTRDVTTGWSGAYDYAALAPHADLIMIMTYEFSGPWGGPGPIAPAPWVDDVISFVTSQIPSEKVLLGLAFYGYDWNTVSGETRALGYLDGAALAARYGTPIVLDSETASGTFRYAAPAGTSPPALSAAAPIQHVVTRRVAPHCDVSEPPRPPAREQRPPSRPGVMEEHVVWIEESGSTQARLQIADRYRTGGVAAWRLGQDDPGVWPILRNWRGTTGE